MYEEGIDEGFALNTAALLYEAGFRSDTLEGMLKNIHKFGMLREKLLIVKETEKMGILRSYLKDKAPTTFEEVFNLFHELLLCKGQEKGLLGWDVFLGSFATELVKAILVSKNEEEADKYFTYWGTLAGFYKTRELFDLVILFADWATNEDKLKKCFRLGIKFDYDFHIKEGFDVSIFKDFKEEVQNSKSNTDVDTFYDFI